MTQHSIPLTKCKTELHNTLSRLTTLMHSWLIRVTLVAGKVFTHNCDTGNPSAIDSVLKHCAANRKTQHSALPNVSPYIYIYITLFSHTTHHCMPHYTHHKPKGNHHSVCIYVFSDYCCHCMPYYTHHKRKGAHHYVCGDVLSGCSFD